MKNNYNKVKYDKALQYALDRVRTNSGNYLSPEDITENAEAWNNSITCSSIKRMCKHDITSRLYCIMMLKNIKAEKSEILSILNISESKYKYTINRFASVIRNTKPNHVLNHKLNTFVNRSNKPAHNHQYTVTDINCELPCVVQEDSINYDDKELVEAKKELSTAWSNLKNTVKSLISRWS